MTRVATLTIRNVPQRLIDRLKALEIDAWIVAGRYD